MFFNKLIDNFKKILTDKYFCFEGRAGREEFWMWVLATFIIGAVIGAVAKVLPAIGGIISGLWMLAILLPSLGAAVRRLHDINKSGWFILLNAIPLFGQLALIYLWASEGTSGSNQFGPRPSCCCCCAGNDQPAEDAKNIDSSSDNRQ